MSERVLTVVRDEKLKRGDVCEACAEREIFDLEGGMVGEGINGLNISVSDVSCLYCWNMHVFNANSK